MNKSELKVALKELTDALHAEGHAAVDIYHALLDHAADVKPDEEKNEPAASDATESTQPATDVETPNPVDGAEATTTEASDTNGTTELPPHNVADVNALDSAN